jgi:hypothetical protein
VVTALELSLVVAYFTPLFGVKTMEIVFSKFKRHEYSSAFDDFKLYIKPIVDSAIGWDEDFQRTSFESRLKPE